MSNRPSSGSVLSGLLALAILAPRIALAAGSSVTEAAGPTSAPIAAPAPASAPSSAGTVSGESNQARAHALVEAAINLTDSDRAVKLLWQATTIDPSLTEAYIYLALFYNSRSNFDKVVDVYQRLIKYRPNDLSAYLNIGEAYMSFTPPRMDDAVPYYRKALGIDSTSSFAALRLGQIYAQQGNRGEAVKLLRQASADRVKNPAIAAQADKFLRDMGS